MKANSSSTADATKIFLLLAFAVVLACQVVAQPAPDSILITDKQDNQTISVRKGQVIRIELPAQLGTGYSWHFSTSNHRLASLAGEPDVLHSSDRVGAPEAQVFHIRILRAGRAHLQFDYWRPWERDVSPLKSFRLTVLARNKDWKD